MTYLLNWRFRCTRVLNNIAIGRSQPTNARQKRGIPKSKRRYEEVVNGWFALAAQVDRLDRERAHHNKE